MGGRLEVSTEIIHKEAFDKGDATQFCVIRERGHSIPVSGGRHSG